MARAIDGDAPVSAVKEVMGCAQFCAYPPRRQRWVLMLPSTTQATLLDTYFVRSGYLMFWPSVGETVYAA